MAEPDKRQIGDGSDNYGEAAKQMAKAAKEAGIETAKQAAVKGAEAGANAAAATVQAGVEGGKAVAEIAAGTAAGGPWGAILSAAWAMRHTLFWMDYASRISGRSLPYGCCCGLSTMWIPWRIILRSTRPKSFF